MNDIIKRIIRIGVQGSVNVFVVLIMIPTLAFTGVMVDFARMNMVRSQVQNVAYLVANSALAYYNSLLFEVYGLLGTSDIDEIERFINIVAHRSLGLNENGGRLHTPNFNLFGIGNIVYVDLGFGEDDHYTLNNLAQLRHQINRYMSLRALLQTDLIKTALNSSVADLMLENAANDAALQEEVFNDVLDSLGTLQKYYRDLELLYIGFEEDMKDLQDNYIPPLQEDISQLKSLLSRLDEVEAAIEAIKSQIEDLWSEASSISPEYDDDGGLITTPREEQILVEVYALEAELEDLEEEKAELALQIAVLEARIVARASSILSTVNIRKEVLEEVRELSEKIDEKAKEVKDKIEAARERLNAGRGITYSPAIVDELLGFFDELLSDTEHGPPVILDELLKEHGEKFKTENERILNDLATALESIIDSPRTADENSLNFEIEKYATDEIRDLIYRIVHNSLGLSEEEYNRITEEMGLDLENGEVKSAISERDTDHLNEDYVSSDRIAPRHNLVGRSVPDGFQTRLGIDGIDDFFESNAIFAWALDEKDIIPRATRTSTGTQSYLDSSLALLDFPVNRLLTVEYGVQMFSNFTTNRRMINGELRNRSENDSQSPNDKAERNLSGIPIDERMHYMFGAELEFLLFGINGDRNGRSAAQRNVNAAIATITVQRAAANFLFVLKSREIRNTKIKMVKMGLGKVGAIAAKIYTAALVFEETRLDIRTLLAGQRVPMFKSIDIEDGHFRTGINHMPRVGDRNVWGTQIRGIQHDPATATSEGKGSYYYEYLRMYLLLLSVFPLGLDYITNNIATLIELNMNYHLNDGSVPNYPHHFKLSEAYVLTRASVEVEFNHFFIGNNALARGIGINSAKATATRGY
ncbi:MAG: DUF5702 domain-containing protein [Defluviitaleaceae bacterium]|nr:DUF5702 domain-containing protein [Defluviitaleaceae bacterium]